VGQARILLVRESDAEEGPDVVVARQEREARAEIAKSADRVEEGKVRRALVEEVAAHDELGLRTEIRQSEGFVRDLIERRLGATIELDETADAETAPERFAIRVQVGEEADRDLRRDPGAALEIVAEGLVGGAVRVRSLADVVGAAGGPALEARRAGNAEVTCRGVGARRLFFGQLLLAEEVPRQIVGHGAHRRASPSVEVPDGGAAGAVLGMRSFHSPIARRQDPSGRRSTATTCP